MILILLYFYPILGLHQIDFLQERGIAIRNLSWYDGAFYSQVRSQEVHVTLPIPKFEEDFTFQNGCNKMSTDLTLKNGTAADYNIMLSYLISQRIDNLFFAKEQVAKDSAASSASREETTNDLLYLPSPLFAVDAQSTFHGFPAKILPSEVFVPENIIGSGITALSSVDSLADNKTNTYCFFSCEPNNNHYFRFMVRRPAKGMVLVFRVAMPTRPFHPIFRISNTKNEGLKRQSDNLCQVIRNFGSGHAIQAWILSCNEINGEMPVELMLSINLGHRCEDVRLAEIAFYPMETDTSNIWSSGKSRRRRQFGEIIGGLALAAGLSSWGSSWWYHSADSSKIKNLKKTTQLVAAHEEDFDKTFVKETQDTTLVNDYTKKLVSVLHDELCQFETDENRVKLQYFLMELSMRFLTEVEATLTHSSIPIEGNAAQKAAIQICRANNKDNLDHLCLGFYSKNIDNYKIQSVLFRRKEDDRHNILGAVITILVNVPTFLNSNLMTIHQLYKIPIPLFKDESNLFHFAEYPDLPEIYGHFPALSRKISLEKCKKFATTYYCPLSVLNRLYSSQETCLNSIFTPSPSCVRRIIRSYSSCIGDYENNVLLLSHVGSVSLTEFNDQSTWSNIQNFHHENDNKLLTSNVTIISGKASLVIRCEKSEFRYFGQESVITSFLQIENSTQKFPTAISTVDGFEALKISDTNFEKYLSQMGHVQDEAIKNQLQLQKLANRPDYFKNSPFDDETTSDIFDWAVPILCLTTIVSTIAAFCFVCRNPWCRNLCCCPERRTTLKNEYKIAKRNLCVREEDFGEPQPQPRSRNLPTSSAF